MSTAREPRPRSRFEPAGFFGLRTPLLPFDEILAWADGLKAPAVAAGSGDLDRALAADRELLRRRLRVIVERADVREAVFLASPDLAETIAIWRDDPTCERGQKVERSLVRYFLRAAGRPTPFGLFAGSSVGAIGGASRLELAGRASYVRHTRLDMDYLFLLAAALECQPDIRSTVSVRPNSSLYRVVGRFRYAEAKLRDKTRTYQLVAVDDSEYLSATLARARGGALPTDLAQALVAQDADISAEEARAFVDELLDSQILVSDLIPAVTGPEPIHELLAHLDGPETSRAAVKTLRCCANSLKEIDGLGLGLNPDRYEAIARDLGDLPAKVQRARLFQVDLVKPVADARLGDRVVSEVMRGVDILHRLGRMSTGPTTLARFRDAFAARYEAREIPLVEALDEELGLGFESSSEAGAEASPLLEGLVFSGKPTDLTVTWDERQGYLFLKLEECFRSGSTELCLTPEDLDRLARKDPEPLPDAFAISAILAAGSDQALAQGDFQLYLVGGMGPSGARLLGRFCHADSELHRLVRRHLRAEEALEPDAIFAEIVHLPEGRIGNVLCRPVLRDHEIPFLGRSGAPLERQIPITDLLVSVRGDRVVLRSRRLGRRVVPRLSTAHNYHARALGLYKFLCCLQEQGLVHGLAWDWGIFQHAKFLPRVSAGRLILSRACWRLNGDDVRELGKLSEAALFRAVQTLRAERGLPRWALLSDGDNELPVDFDNILSIETFVDLVKARPHAVLVEMFPGPEGLVAHGPEGRFVHELVIPFTTRMTPAAGPSPAPPARERSVGGEAEKTPVSVPRTFLPGSEWMYVKLYTGAATSDQVLREVVGPVTREALSMGAADSWFFLRYADPDWHVRWRLHGSADRLRDKVMPRLNEAAGRLVAGGLIRRVQYDTYEREVERFGGPEGIVLAERIFEADSEAAVGIVELLSGDAGMDARWRLTLRGVDMLLNDLGLKWKEKRAVIKTARTSFARDFPADRHQLAEKFRREKTNLVKLLDPNDDDASPLAPGFRLLRNRSQQLAPIAKELRAAISTQRVSLPMDLLCGSFIHLHANRLLRSTQRAQEFVIYFFLDRLYEGMEARGNLMC